MQKKIFLCEDNANSIYQNSSLNNFEKSKFDKLLNEKFLLYENLFKKAGEENNVEWELLAISLKNRNGIQEQKI